MKRFFALIAVFVLFSTILPTNINFGSAVTESLWGGNTLLESDVAVDEADRTNAYCEWGNMSQRMYSSVAVTDNVEEVFADAGNYELSTRETCMVQNKYGLFGGNINGTNLWSPSGNPDDAIEMKNANIIAAPASNVVLVSSTNGSDPFGSKRVSINYNLPGIGKLLAGYRGSGLSQKMLKQWALTSQAPQLQYADGSPMLLRGWAFSANGRYMVGALTTGSLVRIDLQTQSMQSVAHLPSAARGWQLAVSNDGDYVLSHDVNASALTFHDLSGCVTQYPGGGLPSSGADLSGCISSNIQADITGLYPEIPVNSKRLGNLRFGSNSASYTIDMLWTIEDVRTNRRLTYTPDNYVSRAEGYLALGDSYTSGEGDTEGGTWYEQGTDEQGNADTFAGRNLCHLSRRSYPYLMAIELGYLSTNTQAPPSDGLFHSVACSGAKIHNVVGGTIEKQTDGGGPEFSATDNQYRYDDSLALGSWQPGTTRQTNFLSSSTLPSGGIRGDIQAEVITVGIGGNDVSFGKLLAACTNVKAVGDTCEFAQIGSKKSINLIKQVAGTKSRLVRAYQEIKNTAPEARIYVHGYPSILEASGGNCSLNVRLDAQERLFAENFVQYLNQVIRSAAEEAGVLYVDIEDIFVGAKLCTETADENIAVNGATAGNDIAVPILGRRLGSESFHPRSSGFKRYKDRILSATNNLTAPIPAPDASIIPVPGSFFGSDAILAVERINTESNGISEVFISNDESLIRDFDFGTKTVSVQVQALAPSSEVEIVVESDPVSLGLFMLDENGALSTDVVLPTDLEPGYHEIHIYGQDKFGKKVDQYQGLFLAVAADDFDGDGIVDSADSCAGIENSGIDADKDGIDDVCDGRIDAAEEEPENEAYVQFCEKLSTLQSFMKTARPKWLYRGPKRIVRRAYNYYCTDPVVGLRRFNVIEWRRN